MRFRDYITIDKLDVVGDLLVMGSFSVIGSASVINTTNLSVSDPIILLAASQSGSPTLDSGFFINRGTGATQGFIWDESTDEFALISTSASSTAIGNIDINSYSNLRLNGLTASQVRINTVSGSDPLIVRNASNTANQLEIQSDGKYRLGDENGGLNNAFSYISDGRLFMVKSGSNFIELNNSGANRLYNISSGWLLDGNTTISTYAVSGSTGSGSFYYFAGTFQIGDLVATGGASNALWITNGTVPIADYVNRHWYYSADVSAGNAAPHFRTENGSVIKLYNYGTVSTVQGIADALTGMGILGTSSVNVLSGSGTAGYLPKFTGTYSIGNSGFADDGNIGGYISGGATLSIAFTSTQVLFRDGSITVPGIAFQNDGDTGFYRNTTNQITVMAGGNTSSTFTDKGLNFDSDITNNTVYGIPTASNDSEAVRYSQLLLTESYLPKSGYVEGASFSGSPLSYTVNFVTQFADDNSYSISVIGEDSRAWSVSNVTKTQFTIESNSSTTLTGRVRWMAQKYNDV